VSHDLREVRVIGTQRIVNTGHELKRLRQRAIRQLVLERPVSSQREVVDALTAQGFEVTQATVSRDITELGLHKAARADGHVYVVPEERPAPPSDERLRRILRDIPVRVGRSGLTLVLTGSPGTASVIAQAIDESTLREQEGTLAGDNTLLVLFADEPRLERWLERFETLSASDESNGAPAPTPIRR
jgi:transcriptional regulator of arginine metabolism